MNGILLLNGNAGSMVSDIERELREVASEFGLKVLCPESPEDSERAIVAAVQQRVPLVVSGGGDGTVHHVANTLLAAAEAASLPCPTLGVAPLGTGNDFARTLGLSLNPVEGLRQTLAGESRSFDVLRVRAGDELRYCINVAAGGFAGLVDEQMDDATKRALGPLAYVLAAGAAFRELTPHEVTFELDGRVFTEEVINIVVANARTCGGGAQVAPTADPEDGLLDLVIVTPGSLLELAGVAASLRLGTLLSDPRSTHAVGRSLKLSGVEGVVFNVDGELLSQPPTHFEVLPGALPVRVGPDYKRERWTLPPD